MIENEMNLSKDPVPNKGEHIKGRGRVLTYGLYGEELSILRQSGSRTAARCISGARAILLSERAYQGGPSAADRADRMDL